MIVQCYSCMQMLAVSGGLYPEHSWLCKYFNYLLTSLVNKEYYPFSLCQYSEGRTAKLLLETQMNEHGQEQIALVVQFQLNKNLLQILNEFCFSLVFDSPDAGFVKGLLTNP